MSHGNVKIFRLLMVIPVFMAFAANGADVEVEKGVKPQRSANSPAPPAVPEGETIPAPITASPYGDLMDEGPRRPAPVAPSKEVVIVPLDNTGVVDFRFLNPRRPVFVRGGAGVEFRNDTSDRTFSVSIPVSIMTTDPEYTYPVLQRAVDTPRIRQYHLEEGLGLANYQVLPYLAVRLLDDIDRLSRVRELIKNVDLKPNNADPTKGSPEGLPQAVDDARAARFKALNAQLVLIETRLGESTGPCCPPLLKTPVPAKPEVAECTTTGKAAAPPDAAAPTAAPAPASGKPASVGPGPNARDLAIANAYAELARLTKERNSTPEELRTRLESDIRDQEAALAKAKAAKPADLPPAAPGEGEIARLRQEHADVCAEIRRQEQDTYFVEERKKQYIDLLTSEDSTKKTIAGSRERALEAKADIVKEIATSIERLIELRKAEIDAPILTVRDAANRKRRRFGTWFSAERRAASQAAGARIRLADRALAELDAQGKADANAAVSARFAFVELSGCSGEEKYTCSAVRVIPPGQSATFPGSFMAVATPATTVIKFQVRFFDEAQDPANSVAYLTRSETPTPPPPEFTLNLVGSVGQKRDAITEARPPTPAEGDPPPPPPACTLLCTEGHRNHFQGSGRLDARQRVADYFEGSGSLSFKSGDLGGADTTNALSFSKYQFNVMADNGMAIHFGKFDFAKPTSGIAMNESGEGFRLLWYNFAGGYIVKRESAKKASDRANRDSTSFVAQATNFTLAKSGFVRSLSVYATRGDDRTPTIEPCEPTAETPCPCTPTATTPCPAPTHAYQYETFGGEVSYAIPIVYVSGNFGYYVSSRNVKAEGTPCKFGGLQCDGSGHVALLTINRAFALDAKNRPARSVTVTLARGTGDNPVTTTRDEGYIGETSGFAPDQIFLGSLVASINKYDSTEASFTDLNVGAARLGSGLSNKDYAGIQYVENMYSPLYTLIRLFGMKDVATYSTTFSYHNYRLRRHFIGERGAGHEFDVSFLLESPKGVKTTIAAGYYVPGPAVTPYVNRNLWTVSSNVSVSFGQ